MASQFTETYPVDMNKEKDWAYQLGLMDWDKTKIVFTKRQLIEFLSDAGVTIDPNLIKIQKLPKYAKFGRMSAAAEGAEEIATGSESKSAGEDVTMSSTTRVSNPPSGFRPTRRVREAPGGTTHIFFGEEEEEEVQVPVYPSVAAGVAKVEETVVPTASDSPDHKRTETRIRNGPTLGLNMFEASDATEFKPTRRVRDHPGGEDHLHNFFG